MGGMAWRMAHWLSGAGAGDRHVTGRRGGTRAAQQRLELFDAHLHYNQEPNPFYPLDKVLEVFRRNGVTGILATSRPNKGTHQLVDAKAPGLWVVPFIRPYRVRADIQTWFNDPAIFELIQERVQARLLTAASANSTSTATTPPGPLVKTIVDFAVEHDLYLHAHCDEAALLHLFAHNARAKIIWAHTGFTTPPARVRGAAGEISGALGRAVLPLRHHQWVGQSHR